MTKTKKLIIGFLGLVLITGVIFVSAVKNKPDDSIKIGAILSLTGGSSAFYGEHAKRGIDIAVAKINSSGGINGKSLSVVYQDSQGQQSDGISALNKLMAEGVKVIIGGDVSGITLAMAPVAEKNKVILIAPAGAAPAITNAGDYIFRTKVSAAVESKIVAQYLGQEQKIKKVAFLYQNSDYGKGVFVPFKADLDVVGVKTVAEENYQLDSLDFRTQLTKLKASPAEVIILAGFSKEVGEILKEAREFGIEKKFFAQSGAVGPDVIKFGGKSADGLVYLSELMPDVSNPATADFLKVYKQKYNEDLEFFSMLACDTLMVIGDGLKKCSDNTDCLKSYLYSIKDYPGITGPISFDQNGDIVRNTLVPFTIKNGQFVPVK